MLGSTTNNNYPAETTAGTTGAVGGPAATGVHGHHHNHNAMGTGAVGTGGVDDAYHLEGDRDKYGAFPTTTIFLKPIAAPSALGLASYASGTFVVASWLAMWWGGDGSAPYLWPFVLIYGGLAQIFAGMWAFNARDTLATVFHTTWGSFLLSLSLIWAFNAAGTLPLVGRYDHNPMLATWTVALAVVTLVCAMAAVARDLVTAVTLLLLGVGCIFTSIGWYTPSKACIVIGAYLWLVSCLTAVIRMAVHLLVEAMPHKYRHGSHDMMPRMGAGHRGAMYEQGWKDANSEPGVVKGNL